MATMNAEITSFNSFSDASGAPSTIVVRHGKAAAYFAMDYLDGITCNSLGSGMTCRMTEKAADCARRLYLAKIETLGAGWVAQNKKMYSE